LAEPWADSGSSTGRLMLAVLGGLADVERDLIRTRTAEGRSCAKAQGKRMGRPPSLTVAQQKEAIRRRAQGATLEELARSYNVRFQGCVQHDRSRTYRPEVTKRFGDAGIRDPDLLGKLVLHPPPAGRSKEVSRTARVSAHSDVA
jgi:hypothetical protein